MIGEIWTYKATKPSDNLEKARPVLIIGNDANNGLQFIDINYVIVSSSADCGQYDVRINEQMAKKIGLNNESTIKTTKIYTGSQKKLGNKIGDLPEELKTEFMQKYKAYQDDLINKWN